MQFEKIKGLDKKISKLITGNYNRVDYEKASVAQNIAGAWPLNFKFSSFALIAPRKIDEIDSSLKNLSVELTDSDVNLLNLKERN